MMFYKGVGERASLSAESQAIRQANKAKSRRISVLRDFFFHGYDTPKTLKSPKRQGFVTDSLQKKSQNSCNGIGHSLL